MPPLIPLTGQRFHRLVVLDYQGKSLWRCRCDCGNITVVNANNLRGGHTQSCGCLKDEALQATWQQHITHGASTRGIYARWRTMIQRCYNPNNHHFSRYGGRGITVCKAWLESFAAFYADMGDPLPDMQLERRDNDGPYSPENCYWATPKQQANNRHNNHYLTFDDETHTITEWGNIRHIDPGTLFTRLSRGWTLEEMFTIHAKPGGHYVQRPRRPRTVA